VKTTKATILAILLVLAIIIVGVSTQPLYSRIITENEYCICLLYNEEAVLNQPFRLIFEFCAYRNMSVHYLRLKVWLVEVCGNYYLLHSSTILENTCVEENTYIEKVIVFNVAISQPPKDPILLFEVYFEYSHENGTYTVKKSVGAIPVRSISYSVLVSKNEQLKQENSELKEELNEIKSEYSGLKANYSSLLQRYSELQSRYDLLFKKYINVTSELIKIKTLYSNLLKHLSNVSENYEELQQQHYKVLDILEDYKAKYNSLKNEYNKLLDKYNKLYEEHLYLQQEYLKLMYLVVALAGVCAVLVVLLVHYRRKAKTVNLPPPPPPPPPSS